MRGYAVQIVRDDKDEAHCCPNVLENEPESRGTGNWERDDSDVESYLINSKLPHSLCQSAS